MEGVVITAQTINDSLLFRDILCENKYGLLVLGNRLCTGCAGNGLAEGFTVCIGADIERRRLRDVRI